MEASEKARLSEMVGFTWWRQIPDGESDSPTIWSSMKMEMSQLQNLVGGKA